MYVYPEPLSGYDWLFLFSKINTSHTNSAHIEPDTLSSEASERANDKASSRMVSNYIHGESRTRIGSPFARNFARTPVASAMIDESTKPRLYNR